LIQLDNATTVRENVTGLARTIEHAAKAMLQGKDIAQVVAFASSP
jgi:hypothetical protein